MKINFAIIDSNALSGIGLQILLREIIPDGEVTVFRSYEEFVMNDPSQFVHYFVASAIYFEHAQYFLKQSRHSIVLVHGEGYPHLPGLLTLNVCQDEKGMAKSLLALRRRGHAPSGQRMAETPVPGSVLSARETEVAILLSKGYINKEVADRLNISLTTAITHRKNIMDKLHARSLADIIIYVVVNGLANVEDL